jgi:site-specific DNA-methyltransferase (adenine-specific)
LHQPNNDTDKRQPQMIDLDGIQLHHGDCRQVLASLPDCSVDSVVTDPPYELGFMGKAWDGSGIAYSVEMWAEVLRVLKPGGHLCAFGGTRTYHRMACAIEDAGFEIRDSLHWVYGSGFPKSLDVSKAIDKTNGEPDRLLKFTLWFRTAGLTAKEVTRMLQTAGVISENGTMAGHYFAKSRDGQPAIPTAAIWQVIRPHIAEVPDWVDELVARIEAEREVVGKREVPVGHSFAGPTYGGDSSSQEVSITTAATDAAKQWEGWGTALKPAHEPIVLARKPLIGTVAANVLTHGTGALNIDGARVEGQGAMKWASPRGGIWTTDSSATADLVQNEAGRWPANVIFDTEAGALLDEQSGVSSSAKAAIHQPRQDTDNAVYGHGLGTISPTNTHNDSGGASRFFTSIEWEPEIDAPFRYVPKPSKQERNAGLDGLPERSVGDKGNGLARRCATCNSSVIDGCECPDRTFINPTRTNHHPTVKPLALMRWLVRLVTPPGGTVLEPFAGSGTTLMACVLEGFNGIGIEMTDEYLSIIEGRVRWAQAQPPRLFL